MGFILTHVGVPLNRLVQLKKLIFGVSEKGQDFLPMSHPLLLLLRTRPLWVYRRVRSCEEIMKNIIVRSFPDDLIFANGSPDNPFSPC